MIKWFMPRSDEEARWFPFAWGLSLGWVGCRLMDGSFGLAAWDLAGAPIIVGILIATFRWAERRTH